MPVFQTRPRFAGMNKTTIGCLIAVLVVALGLMAKGLDEDLTRELARSRRLESPMCVALLDLDDFKKINDAHGHDTGDAALVHLAHVARQVLRPQDTVARYGGEEFVCLLPETDHASALLLAGRLEQRVREQALPHAHSGVAPVITISMATHTNAGRMPPRSNWMTDTPVTVP